MRHGVFLWCRKRHQNTLMHCRRRTEAVKALGVNPSTKQSLLLSPLESLHQAKLGPLSLGISHHASRGTSPLESLTKQSLVLSPFESLTTLRAVPLPLNLSPRFARYLSLGISHHASRGTCPLESLHHASRGPPPFRQGRQRRNWQKKKATLRQPTRWLLI